MMTLWSPFLGEGGPESTMTIETACEISSNPDVMKRLAKYLAQQCFRNTMLEDLHAGITPNSETGDYTDVVVRSPYGEIPWPRLSRLSDEEMKALMIDVVNKTYHALTVLFDNRLGGELIKILAQQDFLPRWNEPTLS
jgi:ligand-binding SRPBCC domain-containing protein